MKDNKNLDTNGDGRISWSELNVRDKVALITAVISFILGWGLVVFGFIVSPLGVISGSVLSAFGEALLYVASVLGLTSYFSIRDFQYKAKLDNIEKRVSSFSKEDDEEM